MQPARRAPALRLLAAPDVQDWSRVATYAALPTVGLVGGPAYADIVFALGAVCFLHQLAFGAAAPRLPRPLPALAVGFVLLCLASAAWSVAPGTSLSGSLQMAGILLGAGAFAAAPPGPAAPVARTNLLFAVFLAAACAGAAIFWADRLTGYHLQIALSHKADLLAPTKYNRGIDYLVLLSWPPLGFFCWRRRWLRAALLLLLIAAVAIGGASLAGKVAFVAGLATLGFALWAPAIVGALLRYAIPAAAFVWPFVLRWAALGRVRWSAYLKPSAMHRLEIWDYMTGHVLQRPLLGWGLLSSRFLPVPASDLRGFRYVHGPGVYPHDQWLQLWVETGVLGLALGAAFAFVVAGCARRLPAPVRPFAYAAIVAALVISAVNFEVTTDSWWAAIAATGFLFLVLGRSVAERAGQGAAFARPKGVIHLGN